MTKRCGWRRRRPSRHRHRLEPSRACQRSDLLRCTRVAAGQTSNFVGQPRMRGLIGASHGPKKRARGVSRAPQLSGDERATPRTQALGAKRAALCRAEARRPVRCRCRSLSRSEVRRTECLYLRERPAWGWLSTAGRRTPLFSGPRTEESWAPYIFPTWAEDLLTGPNSTRAKATFTER
jgi:hypothetical protein